MKKQIIAIGRGCFGKNRSDFAIERYLIAQTGKLHPKVCFLSQASAEAKDYIISF